MICPHCGYALAPFEKDCSRCQRVEQERARAPAPVISPVTYVASPAPFQDDSAENTSGTEYNMPLPIAERQWNWGAFCLGWFWCFFHGSAGLAMRGYQLAWQRRRFSGGVSQFASVQRAWAIGGASWLGAAALFLILLTVVFVIPFRAYEARRQNSADQQPAHAAGGCAGFVRAGPDERAFRERSALARLVYS